MGSELLTRKKWTPGDWSKHFYWYMDENVSMPDKMVLRSGWNADDLFALVECAPGGGHSPALPGAVEYLSGDRSVFLTANPYQTRRRQNVVFLNDREGWPTGPRRPSAHLVRGASHATIGRLAITGYQNLPAAKTGSSSS